MGEPVMFKFKGLPSFKVHVEVMDEALWPSIRSVDLHCGGDINDRFKPDFQLPHPDMVFTEAKQYWRERFSRGYMEARHKAGDNTTHPTTAMGPLWVKHGPDAMVEFLTELIVDAVLAIVKDGSHERMRAFRAFAPQLSSTEAPVALGAAPEPAPQAPGATAGLPGLPKLKGEDSADSYLRADLLNLFSPEAPMAAFPKLNGEDVYLPADQQTSPPLLLGLAAGVWKAVKRRDQALQQSLDKVKRIAGGELLKAALNAPVAYRSAKKGKLLSGPVLMFLLEQGEQDEFDQLVAQDLQTAYSSRIQALLDAGARINARYLMYPIGTNCGLGEFPIICLAGHDPTITAFLLEREADVNRPSVHNFFPAGNPLWIAIWRGQEAMIDKLLERKEPKDGESNMPNVFLDVNSFGWYPDSSPLTLNQEPAGCNVLALASTLLGIRHINRLLEMGAQLGDCPNELASFLLENARPLARHVAKGQPQNMANGSVLQQTSGMRIEVLVQEILRDDESRRRFLDAIDRACHSLGSEDYCAFMRMLSDLIGRAPAAAARLCDESLQQPKVNDHRRHPLRASCLFSKHEQQYNAYVGTWVWDSEAPFADKLAPPPQYRRSLRDILMIKDSMHICGFFRTFWEIAREIVLPDQRQILFCNISVLRTPTIVRFQQNSGLFGFWIEGQRWNFRVQAARLLGLLVRVEGKKPGTSSTSAS